MHVKGYAAPETKAAVDRANLLVKQAEAIGEPIADHLLLFSVLYGFWIANYLASNSEVVRELAGQFRTLAEKQGAPGPIMAGHRLLATTLLCAGDFAGSRAHLDRAMKYYDPPVHRPLRLRFGQDTGTVVFLYRSWTHWTLGYPAAALADASHALKDAREIGEAATLMPALCLTGFTYILCGDYPAANARSDETIPLAEEKAAALWKAWGLFNQGWVLALTGQAVQAVEIMTSAINAWCSTGATVYMPFFLSPLAKCYAELGKLNDAWHHIDEALTAVERTKEKWWEAEINRVAGEIALKPPEPNAAKALAFFERAYRLRVRSRQSRGNFARR
jgi:predicted ATPase